MTLFERRFSADIIKNPSWIIQVGPKSNDKYPY